MPAKVFKRDGNVFHYECVDRWGEDVRHAIQDVVDDLRAKYASAMTDHMSRPNAGPMPAPSIGVLHFNDTTIAVLHTSDAVATEQAYIHKVNTEHEARQNDPEERAKVERHRLERQADMSTVWAGLEALLTEIHCTQEADAQVEGQAAPILFDMLARYIPLSGYGDIETHREELVYGLKSINYKSKEYQGDSAAIDTPHKMRAYVCGQMIHCFEEKVGFPEILAHMIKRSGLNTETPELYMPDKRPPLGQRPAWLDKEKDEGQ